jgi:hypothetical protein
MSAQKYRLKRPEVEAMQYLKGNEKDVIAWSGGEVNRFPTGEVRLVIPGEQRNARTGDWIIRYADGGLSIRTDKEFTGRWILVEDDE